MIATEHDEAAWRAETDRADARQVGRYCCNTVSFGTGCPSTQS